MMTHAERVARYPQILDWHPANHGAGQRSWFVCRERPVYDTQRGPTEFHTDKSGDLIRYTREGAYRKAAQLNAGAP